MADLDSFTLTRPLTRGGATAATAVPGTPAPAPAPTPLPGTVTGAVPTMAVPTVRPVPHRSFQAAADERRLMLHIALTTTGVPPAPEDRHTIRQLAQMDGAMVETVVRWLRYAAQSTTLGGGREPAAGAPLTGAPLPYGDVPSTPEASGGSLVGYGVRPVGDTAMPEPPPLDVVGEVGLLEGLDASLEQLPPPSPSPARMADPRLTGW